MKIVNKAVLIGGLQNLWQIGSIYPLNLLATLYFISRARFKLHTSLDALIAGYVVAGVISLVSNFILALIDGTDSALLLNSFKSFFVFLGVLVYFGVHQIRVEELFKVAVWLFGLTAVAIFVNYIYLYSSSDLSFYQTRSAITWCSGWPQRWVMFAMIGHFVFLCRYDATLKMTDMALALIFLAIILLSATRSAVVGLAMGYIVLSFLSRRDFFRVLVILMMVGAAAVPFFDEIHFAFRLNEIAEYHESDETGSSINMRTSNLWPGIVDSLETARIPFGWGHAGLAFIPHKFFVDQSQMSDIPGEEVGSAESQYFDVLLRQGAVGLSMFLLILAVGLRYSYKLYKAEKDSKRRYLWKASIAWQVAIIFHGTTVETLRLSLYSLFFFLFLGILSNSYYRLTRRFDAYSEPINKPSPNGASNA